MYTIMGFGQASPIQVIDKLTLWAKEKGYPIKHLNPGIMSADDFSFEHKKTRILVVTSVQALTKFKESIDKARIFVLLFDTPLLLDQIPDLIPMDYKTKTSARPREIAFGFKFTKPVYSKLRSIIETAMVNRNNKTITIKAIKYIPTLVNQLETGCTTNMIVDFFYSICSHKSFFPIKRLTFKIFMVGKVSKANRTKMVGFIGTKGYGIELFNRLEAELTSDRSIQLSKALAEVLVIKANNDKLPEGGKSKPVLYARLARDFKIDTHELKELTRIYNTKDIHARYTKESISRCVG